MPVLTKVKNKFRGLLQKVDPALLWDKEYSSGKWDCLSDMPADILYPHVEKYGANGAILDLGCGPGATADEVKSYKSYLGIDVSEVCLEKARSRVADRPASFAFGNITTYQPQFLYDVIVLADALYYVPKYKLDEVLDLLLSHLTPTGVIIVRTRDDAGRHKPLLAKLEKDFAILEKHLYWEDRLSVLIFRARV